MSKKVVLCVDDEQHVLASLRRLLRKEDFEVVTAEGGATALALLRERMAHLVISDQRMPDMTGVELLQKVKELYPETVRVVLSGYADAYLIVDSINKGEIYRFLAKPWDDEELKAAIRQCLEHYDILGQNRELLARTERQNEELLRLNEQLESMVRSRTRSLQFSQEVLERLPVGVLGISREGEMVLSNEFAREEFPGLRGILPGTDLREFLPGETVDRVLAGLERAPEIMEIGFQWEGRRVQARLATLGDGASSRGGILMLEKV